MIPDDIDILDVPENAVIVIHDRDETLIEGNVEEMMAELHKRFPTSLVLILGGDLTIETLNEDELQALLLDLLEHRKGRDGD